METILGIVKKSPNHPRLAQRTTRGLQAPLLRRSDPKARITRRDIGFVLDELEAMDRGGGFLAGAVDLERVGVMGFSKGGAVAGQFCVTHARCKAGINLTGFMYGDIADVNLDKPFLFVSKQESWCPDCFVNELFYKRAESDAYLMKIRGARHTSFGDPSLWGRLFRLSEDGPLATETADTYNASHKACKARQRKNLRNETPMFAAMPTYSLPPAQEAEILTQIVKEVEQALGQSISNYASVGNGQNPTYPLFVDGKTHPSYLLKIPKLKGYPWVPTLQVCYDLLQQKGLGDYRIVYHSTESKVVPYGFLVQPKPALPMHLHI